MPANSTTHLDREISITPFFWANLIVCSISGVVTEPFSPNLIWVQFTYLAHILSSVFLIALLPIFGFFHFKRVSNSRKPYIVISGFVAYCIAVLLSAAGIHIIYFGQTEALRWVYKFHIYLSYTFIFLVVVHIILFLLINKNSHTNYAFANKKTTRFSAYYSILFIFGIFAASFIYDFSKINYSTTSAVDTPYELPYGDHPFRPSQTETSSNSFIDERQIANSNECGTCHTDIYKQWRSSMHSQASSDPTYVTNVSLLAKKKGIASTRYCEGCHSPVALLTGQLTESGKHGGIKGTPSFNEGVGCMGCHGITRAVHLRGVASYEYSPAEDYIFENMENIIANKVNNLLIRVQPQQHISSMARPILKSPKMCATCHVQFMDENINGFGWVKMQDEYRSWLGSNFSRQAEHTYSSTDTKTCADCHLPLTKGEDPSSNRNGFIIDHRTLGANTAIPAINNDMDQLYLTQQFMQSNKISLNIEEPNRLDSPFSRQPIKSNIRDTQNNPYFLYLGETGTIKVTVSSLLVGHNFPGGTTDINEAWLYIRISDAANDTIFENGALKQNQEVDQSAYFYRSIAVDKEGNHVWKHDLFNMAGDSYKNVIPANGSDVVEYNFDVPYWAKSPLTVVATLRYRKFNQRYASWALKNNNIKLPITDLARDSITIPLYERLQAGAFSK